MKLYVVRHGQSLANSLRQHAGWAQVPLTEQGEQDKKSDEQWQYQRLGDQLSFHGYTPLYSGM